MKHDNELVNQAESDSFLKSALTLRGSVTPKVLTKVAVTVIYTLVVSYLCQLYPRIILPIGPFEYGGFLMGLIMVFRINAGYDRWWEARKLWGSVVNQSRNLALIVLNYTEKDAKSWPLAFIQMLAAMPYLMKKQLRADKNLDELKPLLNPDQLRQIQAAEHYPNCLASMMSASLAEARTQHGLDSFAFLQAQQQFERIIDAQGACERILYTPMPFVMAVKSRLFILFFLIMLPFALENLSLGISPLITGLVAFALFSLDKISVELQNPFI